MNVKGSGTHSAQISLRLNKRLLERADALIDFYAQRQSSSGIAQQADVLRKSIELGLAIMEGYAQENVDEPPGEEKPPPRVRRRRIE